jgi:hypothetical protein
MYLMQWVQLVSEISLIGRETVMCVGGQSTGRTLYVYP